MLEDDRRCIDHHRSRSYERDPVSRAPDFPRPDLDRVVAGIASGDPWVASLTTEIDAAYAQYATGIRLPDPSHPDLTDEPQLRTYVAGLADAVRRRAKRG